MQSKPNNNPVVLITGSARRIGAAIAQRLHDEGFNIVLHYRHSKSEAQQLAKKLNSTRERSAITLGADLNNLNDINLLIETAVKQWERLDVLVNNASSFFPTPIGSVSSEQWDDLFNSNLKAPFFLAQAAACELRRNRGCIINIADIYADRPLKNHSVYCAAKAGNVMLTKALALELAPDIRVNGIAPGAILWPEADNNTDDHKKLAILQRIPLARQGEIEDIANTAMFLTKNAPYITGQIIAVDGGRSIHS